MSFYVAFLFFSSGLCKPLSSVVPAAIVHQGYGVSWRWSFERNCGSALSACAVHSDHFRSILHFGRAGHSQRGQGQYRSQLCSLGSVAGSPALGITCEKLVGGTSVWCKPRWPRWRYLLDLPGGCLGICNARCVFSHQRFAIAMVRLDWICTSFVDSVWGNGYSGSLKQKLTASSAVLFLNDASSSTLNFESKISCKLLELHSSAPRWTCLEQSLSMNIIMVDSRKRMHCCHARKKWKGIQRTPKESRRSSNGIPGYSRLKADGWS